MFNKQKIIIFVQSNKRVMNPSKEQKELEKELVYYLRLFNELKGRNGAENLIPFIEEQIDKSVESIKMM